MGYLEKIRRASYLASLQEQKVFELGFGFELEFERGQEQLEQVAAERQLPFAELWVVVERILGEPIWGVVVEAVEIISDTEKLKSLRVGTYIIVCKTSNCSLVIERRI